MSDLDVMIFKQQVEDAAKRFGYLQRNDLEQEGYIALLEIQDELLKLAETDLESAQKKAFDLARNRMSNVLRRQRGKPVEVELSDDMASILPEFSADNEDLVTAMGGLEPTDRYILEECFFHDRPLKDVAAALGWNATKVTRRKQTAIVALRKIMGVRG